MLLKLQSLCKDLQLLLWLHNRSRADLLDELALPLATQQDQFLQGQTGKYAQCRKSFKDRYQMHDESSGAWLLNREKRGLIGEKRDFRTSSANTILLVNKPAS